MRMRRSNRSPLDQTVDVVVLDVDLLASTRTCPVHLAPRLRPGGVIFTQDGHLRAVAALLADWRDEVGVAPPPSVDTQNRPVMDT